MINVLNIMALQHCVATEQGSELYELREQRKVTTLISVPCFKNYF